MIRPRLVLAALALVFLAAATWYLQPERRLRRTWHKLIDVVEARHARALGNLLAEDYGDRWGYIRDSLVRETRLAFFHFDSLQVRIEQEDLRIEGDRATISSLLRVEVRGTERAAEARVATNALFSPFTFEWRRDERFPWGWKLTRFDQPELDLDRFRQRFGG